MNRRDLLKIMAASPSMLLLPKLAIPETVEPISDGRVPICEAFPKSVDRWRVLTAEVLPSIGSALLSRVGKPNVERFLIAQWPPNKWNQTLCPEVWYTDYDLMERIRFFPGNDNHLSNEASFGLHVLGNRFHELRYDLNADSQWNCLQGFDNAMPWALWDYEKVNLDEWMQ
jgi:hypothetical protein